MKKVNLLTNAEMKNILGGTEEVKSCYSSMDDKICWYDVSPGVEVNGECDYSDNGKQCRCVAWDGESSVPMATCIKPL
ncbi:hypothetical protein WG904_14705 [Pedobacter sp. Du54]|uniref:hypothetical protein n=1 Tax=Pedobacter anseongensis TaxID=3133439 RepID=UPI00309C4199